MIPIVSSIYVLYNMDISLIFIAKTPECVVYIVRVCFWSVCFEYLQKNNNNNNNTPNQLNAHRFNVGHAEIVILILCEWDWRWIDSNRTTNYV